MEFSVLMSVYYKESPVFLKESIDSILNQTLKPSEIVFIKDGILTDELEKVLEYYNEKHEGLFKFVSFDENQGLGKALRKGIEICSYDIIARMDTDDICVPARFEKEIKELIEKNLDVVGSNILEFDGDINNIIAERVVPKTDREIKKRAKKRNPFNHMTVMYRKSAVLKAGNYKDFLWFEDYNLWVRMIMSGAKMYNIQEDLVYARTGRNMFGRRGGKEYIKREYKMQKYMLNHKFIRFTRFYINVISRSFVRIVPNKVRRMLYIKMLRK